MEITTEMHSSVGVDRLSCASPQRQVARQWLSDEYPYIASLRRAMGRLT